MGLIQAGIGAAGGVLADSWRDYFYCDSLEANVLAAKGKKRTSSQGRSSNVRGEDNIISNGSIIAVNEGQCMIIVEQGEIVEICATPGEFAYDTSTEPSIFTGDLMESVKASFNQMCKRFTFGGNTAKDQRVYYFNTKEIVGNKYGTASPVPFRVVDVNAHLDLDISVRCNGEYSYRLTDPILFYKNVCGNVEDVYTRDKIDSQLKSELLGALQPAFARISEMGIRYSAIPGHTTEIADALNEVLSSKWAKTRGISVASFGVNSISASEEDEERIKNLQTAAALQSSGAGFTYMAAATADSMRTAAANENGAVNGLMGVGMIGGMTGMGAGNVMAAAAQQQQQATFQSAYPTAVDGGFGTGTAAMNTMQQNAGAPAQNQTAQMQAQIQEQHAAAAAAAAEAAAAAAGWDCVCGSHNTGKFCPNCGTPAPVRWTCTCGTVNTGNFCPNCGSRKPQ